MRLASGECLLINSVGCLLAVLFPRSSYTIFPFQREKKKRVFSDNLPRKFQFAKALHAFGAFFFMKSQNGLGFKEQSPVLLLACPSEPPPAGSQFNSGSCHNPCPDLTTSDPSAGGEHCAPSIWTPLLCMTWHIPGLMKSSLNHNVSHKKRETICSWPKNFYLWLSTTGYPWVSGLSKSPSILQSKVKGSFANPVPFILTHSEARERNNSSMAWWLNRINSPIKCLESHECLHKGLVPVISLLMLCQKYIIIFK